MSVYDRTSDAYQEAVASVGNVAQGIAIGRGLAEQLLAVFVDDLEDRKKINAIKALRFYWPDIMGGSIGLKEAKGIVERVHTIFLKAEDAKKAPLPDELKFLLDVFVANEETSYYHSYDDMGKLIASVTKAKAELSRLYKF